MRRTLAMLLALAMMLCLAACGGSAPAAATEAPAAEEPAAEAPAAEEPAADEASDVIPGLEDGVLTIAMECAYAPYNWTQSDDSNGAVPISGTNEYANG